jgi:formylglycine-generating enzyme required for sulfatase activity
MVALMASDTVFEPTPPQVPGYELLQQLGRGGMGEVRLAKETTSGRLVAIKFLSAQSGEDTTNQTKRFQREAELMSQVPHPNVVSVFKVGTSDGQPYLVMEYVDGGDLRKRLPTGQPLPIAQVRALVGPIAAALSHLHQQGILHRDLKPENILLQSGQTPKLADFGLAVAETQVGSLTLSGMAMGTLGYVAPEQHYRLPVDERADQFSLACVVYEMLTGQKPLGAFKRPSEHNPQLSETVDAVVMRALQEDRDDRYANVAEFAAALDLALASARPKRPRARTIVALLALAMAVGVSLWIYFHSLQKPLDPDHGLLKPLGEMTNSIGMKLVLVPAGEFLMGADEDDPSAEEKEKPQHRERIANPFYVSVYEVTMGQFRAFVEDAKYRTEAETDGGGLKHNTQTRQIEKDPNLNWRKPDWRGVAKENQPVTQVSWNDAVRFCEWLSRKEGKEYRLLTEAEWEYACRAGTTSRWSFGDTDQKFSDFVWYDINSGYGVHPVGEKLPNSLGLFDMHGNAREWCLDRDWKYGAGPTKEVKRVIRGGSSDDNGIETRSTARASDPPSFRYFSLGFRICQPVPPPEGE